MNLHIAHIGVEVSNMKWVGFLQADVFWSISEKVPIKPYTRLVALGFLVTIKGTSKLMEMKTPRFLNVTADRFLAE